MPQRKNKRTTLDRALGMEPGNPSRGTYAGHATPAVPGGESGWSKMLEEAMARIAPFTGTRGEQSASRNEVRAAAISPDNEMGKATQAMLFDLFNRGKITADDLVDILRSRISVYEALDG